MATNQQVTVENIKNPAVKRQMTVASAKMNSRKWRIIDQEIAAVEVKKKDVAPAVAKAVGKLPEAGNSFADEAHDDLVTFAKINEGPKEKATLQAQYEAISGQKPDGRWNEEKLKQKIATLKPNDDEAN